jgi:hypothetical protein
MLCERCASLPLELRRHRGPASVIFAPEGGALAQIVCHRCGGKRNPLGATGLLLDILLQLDQLGLGAGAAPLLRPNTEEQPAAIG